MAVTSRIRRVAQPPDGYLPLSLFDEVRLADPVPLYAFEDVPADVTGLAVDYLSRVARGVPARDAFRVPLAGARLVGRSADAERVLLQFFLSNFCTIFPQYGLPVSSRNCTI